MGAQCGSSGVPVTVARRGAGPDRVTWGVPPPTASSIAYSFSIGRRRRCATRRGAAPGYGESECCFPERWGGAGEIMHEPRRGGGQSGATGVLVTRKGATMEESELEHMPEVWQRGGHVQYVIEGGVPLHGDVHLSGAKNAVTKLMVASMLTEDTCTLHNAPRNLGDTTL